MTVLALDLTSDFGSLAIRRDGRTVLEQALESRVGFAHLVFTAIEKILSDAGATLSGIDCFAVSTGPGAFTGLRVALAAVKGLADVMRKPAIGVSKLRAMASFGTASQRIVLLDARRGDVFAAVYNQDLEAVVEETVTEPKAWLANLSDHEYQIVTIDSTWLESIVSSTQFTGVPWIEAPRNLAGAIAKCAEADLRSGAAGDPSALDANYVRRSDAELYWTDN
ncbi:MAG: tRNA (adenosine(37)-N6)-threonylcarbamoyltransferase complex dimerization subunit type 1 TsaB [Bryobacteraceae bacterium]